MSFQENGEINGEEFKIMNSQLQNLLNLWFSAGMLQLQRVTWNSPANLGNKSNTFTNNLELPT